MYGVGDTEHLGWAGVFCDGRFDLEDGLYIIELV